MTKDSKENQEKKALLGLKEEGVSKDQLDHQVLKETREIQVCLARLAAMAYQGSVAYQVHRDLWDRQEKTAIKENRARLAKRATKAAKEKL